MDSYLLVHYERGQVCGQGGVLHGHFSLCDLVCAVFAGCHTAWCLGRHSFLHLPTVEPDPQHQGTPAAFKQIVIGKCPEPF